MKNKTLRIIGYIFGSIAILLLIATIAVHFYVKKNEDKIVREIQMRINEQIAGKLEMTDMKASLLDHFPKVSVQATNVKLKDSLWSVHQHSVLEAEELYISLDLLELISNTIKVNTVGLRNGVIHIYVDSNNYSNLSVFRKSDDSSANKKEAEVDRIVMHNIAFLFINVPKYKNFHFNINKLISELDYNEEGLVASTNLDMRIKSFTFNIHKGSYMPERSMTAKINLRYLKDKKLLEIPEQLIKLDDQSLLFGGNFLFDRKPAQFEINLHTESIPYKTAISYLSPNIKKHLTTYDFEQPIWLQAKVSGQMKFRSIPHVQVAFKTEDNTLNTPAGDLNELRFQGKYDNIAIPGQKQSDANTLLSFFGINGKFENIPLYVDTLLVLNIIEPKVKTRLRSSFPADRLNNFLTGSSLQMDKGGTVHIDIRYEGGASPRDTIEPRMYGFAKINQAGLKYFRRNLHFQNMNANIRFNGTDILFDNISARTYSSSIQLNGHAYNFLNLYYANPAAVNIHFNVSSPKINLSEFISAIKVNDKPSSGLQQKSRSTTMSYADRINNALNQGTVTLMANIRQLTYKKFTAQQVKGSAAFAGKDILFTNVGLKAADGIMMVNGKLSDMGNYNPFNVKVNMDQVNARKVLYGFDNFGMQSLKAQNIQGLLSTDAEVKGRLREDGSIVGKSMSGDIRLKLEEAELINFQPIQKMGNLIFSNRNVDQIKIKPIDHTFLLRNGTFYIKPLLIESSAMYINVQGQYNVKQGTDLAVAVPLRNPKKDDFNPDSYKQIENFRKGLVINLRLTDDEQGNLKINWDPMRKGGGIYSDNPPDDQITQPAASDSTVEKKGLFKKIFK